MMQWYIDHVPAAGRLLITVLIVVGLVFLWRYRKQKVREGLKNGDIVRMRNGAEGEVIGRPTADILELRLADGNGTYCLLRSVSPSKKKR